MRRASLFTSLRLSTRVLLGAAIVCLFAASPVGAATQTKRVAKEAENTTLGKTVLATTKGRTLYSLSAESNGKFVCSGGCLSVWRPLLVPAAVKPTGPVKLGTVERPDGKTQVTFKGRPLYSFSGDTKAGDANGEGIKDVGTWHAAATGRLAPPPQAPPEPTYPY
jgi:predicted lipoprotein with Yx(FWY)xxD motif